MEAQKRLVPQWGVELDGVWLPVELLEELSEQGPYDSMDGPALTVRRDQERVLLNRGLAVKETKGGLHAGPGMARFWDALEFPGREEDTRKLARQERIEARHWLQVLSEQARSVRNALDPVSGVHTITVAQWVAQRDALTKDLDAFTRRVIENRSFAGGIPDRNA